MNVIEKMGLFAARILCTVTLSIWYMAISIIFAPIGLFLYVDDRNASKKRTWMILRMLLIVVTMPLRIINENVVRCVYGEYSVAAREGLLDLIEECKFYEEQSE